jgi:hypothetical protein
MCLCCYVWRRSFYPASSIRAAYAFAPPARGTVKIEASIAEAYILEEVSNFTTKYYDENLPGVHNPPPRYNVGENDSNLSLF